MRARSAGPLWLALAFLLSLTLPLRADETSVPPQLQASLITRLAPFDRSLAARAQSRVLILVAIRRDDAGSRQVAAGLIAALASEKQIAGLPLEIGQITVGDPQQLIAEIRVRHPAIVYLSSGFTDEVPALAANLSGEDVLTIAAESAAVAGGVCVGFDLVSGKPRLLIHLQQSKKQHVNFQATLLHLAKVVDQ